MENPRKLAHLSLVKSDTQECFTNIEINTVLSRNDLEPKDASLYTLLYLGVIEKKIFLDGVIKQYSKSPIEEIDVETINALRLGFYQLIFTDRIPDYSAVSESVDLCPKKSKGFTNAVLRSFLREDKKISYPKDKWERASFECSIPMEIIDIWKSSYGEDTAYRLCYYENNDHSISLRVNTLKTSVEEIKNKIQSLGYESKMSKYADEVIKCNIPVKEIKDLIDKGLLFVQDESSFICSRVFDGQEGENVGDMCACPGGKTFSIAIGMKNKGQIKAFDLHENKLSLIEKGKKRLGIDIICTGVQNGKEYKEEYKDYFDRVLCDVPCSGLGVIFKKPDIKYKSLESIKGLPCVQYDILQNCSKYVKIGGYLVYSTCTIRKEENEDNVNRFLKENPNFDVEGFEIGPVKSKDGMFTFLPHITETDGFFVAKLKRVR